MAQADDRYGLNGAETDSGESLRPWQAGLAVIFYGSMSLIFALLALVVLTFIAGIAWEVVGGAFEAGKEVGR